MRTASTWTYRCLSLHPDVAFPAGKQVHFLDRNFDRGIDWYRELFSASARVDGDITPGYATVGEHEIDVLADTFGDLRVFFVVRDPIERAWSSARLSIRRDQLDAATLDTEWFIKRLTRPSVQVRNAYEATYERWKTRFGDRFWLADFAGIERDPQGFLIALCDHIGVDPAVYASPTDEIATAIGGRYNATDSVELGPHLDRSAIDAATEATYARDLSWYRAAPCEWPNE